jgi:hypothetical protein
MSRPKIQVNGEVREMNDLELSQLQKDAEIERASIEAAEAKKAARDSALAKLAALGLSEAEVAALVGG